MRQRRGRIKQSLSFIERLAQHATKVRESAAALPPGEEHDAMMAKLEQAQRAARISRWLSSGEEAPEEIGQLG
jgi:hypothetical protein